MAIRVGCVIRHSNPCSTSRFNNNLPSLVLGFSLSRFKSPKSVTKLLLRLAVIAVIVAEGRVAVISLSEIKTSISLNKLSYEAFLSAAMIITYPNPLSFRLNNEAIILKEYLSMTKYLVFEVGFSEKRNKL